MSGVKEKELREMEREAMAWMHKKVPPSVFCGRMGISFEEACGLVAGHWRRQWDGEAS